MEGGAAKGAEGARTTGSGGIDLRAAVAAAHAALEAQADHIDALNVYPVPDGDTGTNMLLTIRSVLREVSAKPGLRGGEAARVVSRAALMGARGNSGVILSQVTRGACEVLGGAGTLAAATVSGALDRARERAYGAMGMPVEGTMLTVIKDAAKGAARAVEGGERDPLKVMRAAAVAAHESVERTPELLGALREAGVVDAGGLGLAVILDGLVAALEGEEPGPVRVLEVSGSAGASVERVPERLRAVVAHSAEEAWGYCTEFLVTGFAGDGEEFSRQIHDMGKSVLVIPDDDLVKVHLHTQNPGSALSYAGSFGRLLDVKVDDMEAQTKARADRVGPADTSEAPAEDVEVGVVAASQGAGNRALFEAMGAVVVEGGQGRNPSAEELARGVEATGARSVIVLPNNKNVVPVAERLGELVEAKVYVVPTKTVAAGLAVMVGYDAEEEPGEVAEEMCEILAGLRYAEVTVAVRDARVEGCEVSEGDYLGFLDGKLGAVGGTAREVAVALAREILGDGADVVTLLVGEGFGEDEAGALAEEIRGLEPGVTVEVKEGGQPVYPILMVAE